MHALFAFVDVFRVVFLVFYMYSAICFLRCLFLQLLKACQNGFMLTLMGFHFITAGHALVSFHGFWLYIIQKIYDIIKSFVYVLNCRPPLILHL